MVKLKPLSILLLLCVFLFNCDNNEKARIDTFNRQLGTYILDTQRTNLSNYKKDLTVYSTLEITFKSDSTFVMNKQVPFFADSTGTWITGNGLPDDYNQFFYKNKNYHGIEGNQFFPPYQEGSDSVFLIVGASAKKGAEYIHKIYFKKKKA